VGDTIKVVYIEDNPANLSLVVRVLEATGRFEVHGAPDGEAGLALIEEVVPNVVLVDLDIPGVNGFEVTRQIRASSDPAVARLPVAAVSANVMKGERAKSLEAGCTIFIEKPFDIRAFREQVAELAEAAAGEEED
jgi:two-component system cell cycle response regulator DivK